MNPFDDELNAALVQVLAYLKTNEGVEYSMDQGKKMLSLILSLKGSEGRRCFLGLPDFMRGQILMAHSDDNRHFFQVEHPDEPVTFDGLMHQWTEHPSPATCAARKYREHDLVIA